MSELLRRPKPPAIRKIMVRVPADLHTRLKHEAHDQRTSLNKLCIHKLRQLTVGKPQ